MTTWRLLKVQGLKGTIAIVPTALSILLFSLVVLNVNAAQLTTDVLDSQVKGWDRNVSSLQLGYPYRDTTLFFADRTISLDLPNRNVTVNSFYVFHLDKEAMFVRTVTNSGNASINASITGYNINTIIMPTHLNARFQQILDEYAINASEIDFLLFNVTFRDNTSWIEVGNATFDSTAFSAISDAVTPNHVLNLMEHESSGIISVKNVSTTLLLFNYSLFDTITWKYLLSHTNQLIRHDFWDLPSEHPTRLAALHAMVDDIEDSMKAQLLAKFDLNGTYAVTMESPLKLLIERIELNYSQQRALVIILFLVLIIVNLRILDSMGDLHGPRLQQYMEFMLIRGSSPMTIFGTVFKLHLVHEVGSVILALVILQVFFPGQLVLIENITFIGTGSALIVIFNLVARLRASVTWINSINTLERPKNDPRIMSSQSKRYKTHLYVIFLLVAFSVLFFILFGNQVTFSRIVGFGLFVLFLGFFFLNLGYRTIVVENFERLMAKIQKVVTMDVITHLIDFNRNVSRTSVTKWLNMTVLLVIVVPLAFSNIVEIRQFSEYHADLYTVSDVYYITVSPTDVVLLSKAPYVIKSTIIQEKTYRGPVYPKRVTEEPISIYLVDFIELRSLISKKSFTVLDTRLQRLLTRGMDDTFNVLASSYLMSTFVSSNVRGIQLAMARNVTLTINQSLSYFPSIMTSNWIVMDASRHPKEHQQFFNRIPSREEEVRYYWIGKIADGYRSQFDDWVRRNVGHVEQRRSIVTDSDVVPFKLQLFLAVRQYYHLLLVLLALIDVTVFVNWLRLSLSIYARFDKAKIYYVIRGASLHAVRRTFLLEFLLYLSCYLVLVFPAILATFSYGFYYLRSFRDEFPNLPPVVPVDLMIGPVVLQLVLVGLVIMRKIGTLRKSFHERAKILYE